MSLCLLLTIQLQAQTQHSDADVLVNITVVDENGEPLPGASVAVAGKPVGVIANTDGTRFIVGCSKYEYHGELSRLEIACG